MADAETGQPLTGALVGLQGTRSRGPRTTATDAEGRFEFRFVEKDPSSTGFALFVAEVPGSGLWEPTRLDGVHPGVPVDLRIRCRFRETRSVSVRILDAATEAPIALGKFGSRWDDPREGAATNHGTSFFNGQIAGRFPVLASYRMTFSAQGYEPQTTTLERLEAEEWVVRLVPTGAPVAAVSAAKYRLRVKVTGGRHPSGADGSPTAWLYFYDAETKRACLSRACHPHRKFHAK